MAGSSTTKETKKLLIDYPSVINGQINIVKFLEASNDLVAVVGKLCVFL